ncbi:MAG: ABC transporter ATP-binding protein [Chloroflexi bacterium]|nr:ABC transporter ATP-binding protein [Chloroflexota bacterium]
MVDNPAVRLAGLTKAFKGGVIAVTDLNLTVGRGQVFGLLGPNGCGKTTTLRMMLGLVHPTSGSAYIFGHQMTPGHSVLRRVGVLVEKPAFVPHLSGRRNLELFWQAGGQGLREANLELALKVAGLGDAIERKAGTYSKGMQQRLGLAQALLNQPELLVLDEPTVGLDPQEVREVRGLIREVAGHGATVILSSHALAEVEQVCSHVAVMDRGRLVAYGAVSDLTRAGSSVYVEVDDIDRAVQILGNLQGVSGVSREPPGLSVRLDGLEREAFVSALVQHGIGVKTITSRHRLEDAFLQVLAEEAR